MPAAPSSNVRATVQWKDAAVYAGEEIECIITFKNTALPAGHEDAAERSGTPLDKSTANNGQPSNTPPLAHTRKASVARSKPSLSRAPSVTSARGVPKGRGHQPALSLNIVSAASRGGLQSAPLPSTAPNGGFKPFKGHGRSLSIMSLGSEMGSDIRPATQSAPTRRPPRVHSRSASLQHFPRSMPHVSTSLGAQTPRQPSPLYESSIPPMRPESLLHSSASRPARRNPRIVSAGNTPTLGSRPSLQQHRKSSVDSYNSGSNSFRFPASQSPPDHAPRSFPGPPKPTRSPSSMHSGQNYSFPLRPQEDWSGASNTLNPLSRVMSEPSAENTPRSSSDLYSMSNHSDETLTSEAPSHRQTGRFLSKPPYPRQASRSPQIQRAEPETLMMGYAQMAGSFTLDGSLVNAAPFEEVKRKGVQGGGGVVGVERPKRSSGVFGAFSWSNIGESLGGLLGGDEMSSMAQMKASAGSKAIPLLSTPQSLLFVNLKLAPGQSQSYSYRFALPQGLPPSYKGRAIKVCYNLTLGVQRPDGQTVSTAEIPYRVLGSYSPRGDILGHDLMSPYILLQDGARTASVAPDPTLALGFPKIAPTTEARDKKTPKQGLEDFLRYTERLVDAGRDPSDALLSPTSPGISRQQSLADQLPESTKETIDFAIMQSNYVKTTGKAAHAEAQSANRFNIARSGQPVAVLTILRPAYRLGEAVIGTLNFTAPVQPSDQPPQVLTYSVLIELESTESVDPSLALRSAASISRVTRKVHGSVRENVLFARQLSFELAIPATAPPTFETTGVSLAWRLKVEFTTQRQAQGLGIGGSAGGGEELLEELATDERGTTVIARELLVADTFEIAVPVKVFGAVGIEGMSDEGEAYFV